MLWKLNQVTAELIVLDWGIGSRYVWDFVGNSWTIAESFVYLDTQT